MNNNKNHELNEVDGVYRVTFLQDGKSLGTIPYTGKSIHYVNSAIHNWYAGILTEKTIEQYKE
tara:strand:+ start:489 stop:677 length:189 start_codon:yes stop_codon:yes gene_type:complete